LASLRAYEEASGNALMKIPLACLEKARRS